jgi:hypothetical protein
VLGATTIPERVGVVAELGCYAGTVDLRRIWRVGCKPEVSGMSAPAAAKPPHAGYRFPVEIISHAQGSICAFRGLAGGTAPPVHDAAD